MRRSWGLVLSLPSACVLGGTTQTSGAAHKEISAHYKVFIALLYGQGLLKD